MIRAKESKLIMENALFFIRKFDENIELNSELMCYKMQNTGILTLNIAIMIEKKKKKIAELSFDYDYKKKSHYVYFMKVKNCTCSSRAKYTSEYHEVYLELGRILSEVSGNLIDENDLILSIKKSKNN